MSGMYLTVFGTILSFIILFGLYMVMRFDFAIKKQSDEPEAKYAKTIEDFSADDTKSSTN